jgi:hypothetical protein
MVVAAIGSLVMPLQQNVVSCYARWQPVPHVELHPCISLHIVSAAGGIDCLSIVRRDMSTLGMAGIRLGAIEHILNELKRVRVEARLIRMLGRACPQLEVAFVMRSEH